MTTQEVVSKLMNRASRNIPAMFSSTEARLLLQFVVGLDNMLAAYMVEYGDELAKTLTQGDDVVEGEVVDDEDQETFGFDSEDGRLDASEEE